MHKWTWWSVFTALLLVTVIAACSSTTKPARTDNNTQDAPRTPRTEPAPEPSPEPPAPVVDDYTAEHDKSRAPTVPKSVEVPLEYGAPVLPAESAAKFFESLEAKWEVSKTAHRGESDSGLHRYKEFRWGNYLPLCICESRSVDDWKYGHGRAVLTFDRLAKDSLLADWSLQGSSTLAIGYMRFGKMHGPWQFRKVDQARQGKAGPLHFVGEYVSGVAHGEFRWYDADGRTEGVMYYKGGKQEDEQVSRVPGGITKRRFSGGVEHGLYRMWNDEGQLVSSAMSYKGRFWGKAEYWYPGHPRYYRLRHIKPGTDSHWEVCYDKDGQLLDQRWLEGTDYTGPFVEYWPGGRRKISGTLNAGKYHGYVNFWYQYGAMVERSAQYENGTLNGSFTEWHSSGKLKLEANYKSGVLDGPYKTYDEDGKLTSETIYENGEIFDPAKQWPAPSEVLDASGKPIQRRYGHWRTETHEAGKAGTPSAVVGMAMAYHEKLGGVVMFGGLKDADKSDSGVNETWLRKDGKWQRIFAGGTAPVERDLAAMAYDSRRGVIVLLGGRRSGGIPMLDTWELSTTGWKLLEPKVRPDARYAASLVYDSHRGVCVLIGGIGTDAQRYPEGKSEVWEWDGTSWQARGKGPVVAAAAAAYDEHRRRVVVNGGTNVVRVDGKAKVKDVADTWVYDGNQWKTCLFPSDFAVSDHAMVYDADQRSIVLLRNYIAPGVRELRALLPERHLKWCSWKATRESHNPTARTACAAAYDRKRREIVVYGGDTQVDEKWVPSRETLVLTDETPADRARDFAHVKRAVEAVPGWIAHDNGEFATSEFYCYSIVYDRKRGVPVMLGAADKADTKPGTGRAFVVYERHGGAWKLIPSATAPALRPNYASWFDARTGLVMLYGGGELGRDELSDLWAWDGSGWRCVAQSTPGTPDRTLYRVWGWDDKRGVLVTVAPAKGTSGVVHEFDGTTWVNTGITLPENYDATQLVYDPVAEKLLMPYPADLGGGGITTEAYHWDGAGWEPASLSLSRAGAGELLYTDHAGKALWQYTRTELRRYDGVEWRTWEQPSGVTPSGDAWQSSFWIEPGSGHVFIHGFKLAFGGKGRNDTLSFDPAKGKLTSAQAVNPWPGPEVVKGADGQPIRRRFGHWRVETQDEMPPAEFGMAMAYHEKLGGVVMFGGRAKAGKELLDQTWLRKEGNWQRILADGAAPPARDYAAVAYDSKRGVIVLYGGRDLRGNPLSDIWELDAKGWTRCTPKNFAAEARAAASLVYDSHRGVCVLVGGLGLHKSGVAEVRSEVLEWDGKDWAKATNLKTAPALFGAAATYDEQRRSIVVHGGQSAPGTDSKLTWVLQNNRWDKLEMSEVQATAMHGMVYDADARTVVLLREFAESLVAQVPAGTWYFAAWDEARRFDHPPARREFAAAYDRGTREIVLFGGAHREADGKLKLYRETLVLTDENDADRAKDLATFTAAALTAPGWTVIDNGELASSEVEDASVARDPKRGVTVMFGGQSGRIETSATREFRDGKWHLMKPANSPSARSGAAMWFDDKSGKVMLYGGQTAQKTFKDLWEWDGQDWRCIHKTMRGGPGVSDAAYDPKRGVLVVLASGDDGRYVHEFDGSKWTATGVKAYGANFIGGQLVYDPIAEKVLFAWARDEISFEVMQKAWHWDGKAWAETTAIVKGTKLEVAYDLHTDIDGKAIWQVVDETIRRFDGTEWQTWKAPTGLNWRSGSMWFENGRVYAHGTLRSAGRFFSQGRNDTLIFDPEKAERVK